MKYDGIDGMTITIDSMKCSEKGEILPLRIFKRFFF
jgi:hypothetical protein